MFFYVIVNHKEKGGHMKKQGESIFIVFIVVGVFVGILGMHLSAGTAVAEKGGLPKFKNDLSTCKEDLEICLETSSLVPQTGQVTCYAPGDDGQLQYGVPCPDERFTDNLDGTITDNLTGLIWTENANCNSCDWYDAVGYCETLAHGMCGLADSSVSSDWRLPNVREISSLIDYGMSSPPLPTDHPFDDVELVYWTSTTRVGCTLNAWVLVMGEDGIIYPTGFKKNIFNVWCVRGGLQIE